MNHIKTILLLYVEVGFNAITEVICMNQCMDISSVILLIEVIKRGKPKDNHTCKISLHIYAQLDDYNIYLTSLNDIFMLYKLKITYTKIF